VDTWKLVTRSKARLRAGRTRVPAGPRPWSRPCSTALLPGRPAPGHCRAWPLGVAQVRPVEQGLATAWGQGLATAEQHLAQDQAARPDTPLPLTKCLVAAPATSRCYGCGAGACGRMTSPRMLRTSAEPMIRGSRKGWEGGERDLGAESTTCLDSDPIHERF
jgi:hypothetical protein